MLPDFAGFACATLDVGFAAGAGLPDFVDASIPGLADGGLARVVDATLEELFPEDFGAVSKDGGLLDLAFAAFAGDEAPAFACWCRVQGSGVGVYRGTSLIRNSAPLGCKGLGLCRRAGCFRCG